MLLFAITFSCDHPVDNYAIGLTYFNNQKYSDAERYFKLVDSSDKSFQLAKQKITFISHFNDSIKKSAVINKNELKKEFNILKKKFKSKKDEFNNVEWFTHKNQVGLCCRNYLMAHVNLNGFMYLEDQYYSSDWIFHTSIQVKIGNKVYNSYTVETYSKNNRTDNSGGSVWENIDYIDGDNGIIKAIADNYDKEIKVRFNGREYYHDFTLPKSDKEAIKDSYRLYYLLQAIKK